MPDRDVLMNVSDNRFFDQTQAIDWSPPFALGLGVPLDMTSSVEPRDGIAAMWAAAQLLDFHRDAQPMEAPSSPNSSLDAAQSSEGEEHEDSPRGSAGSKAPIRADANKQRLVWTPSLHKCFCAAVEKLGSERAKPQAILQLMDVEGVTARNVKSHLQKYRLRLAKQGAKQQQVKHEVKSVHLHVPSGPNAVPQPAALDAAASSHPLPSSADALRAGSVRLMSSCDLSADHLPPAGDLVLASQIALQSTLQGMIQRHAAAQGQLAS